jgi:hypothetical protein
MNRNDLQNLIWSLPKGHVFRIQAEKELAKLVQAELEDQRNAHAPEVQR